jgi:L-rhamnose-H+ transport protein
MSIAVMCGIAFTFLAGLLSGTCMLPMKLIKRWKWENLWLVFSVVALLILPCGLALFVAGNPVQIYAGLSPEQFLLPFLLGAGWGIAQVLFGLSIARLGQALSFAIVIGLGALGGTLVPLFLKNREVFGTSRGAIILAGLVVMTLGIVVSARAGSERERGQKRETGGRYAMALAMTVLCGILAPMINYSFVSGQFIAEYAVKLGVSPVRAGYAVWPVTLIGGLLANVAYCIYLLTKNKTWDAFRGPWWPEAGLSTVMGVLWMGGMATYGVASVYLGALGTSVGYGLFNVFIIIVANLGGVVTGEWTSAPKGALRTLYAGLAMLIIATGLLAAGNY